MMDEIAMDAAVSVAEGVRIHESECKRRSGYKTMRCRRSSSSSSTGWRPAPPITRPHRPVGDITRSQALKFLGAKDERAELRRAGKVVFHTMAPRGFLGTGNLEIRV
jgi:hypothetical protein